MGDDLWASSGPGEGGNTDWGSYDFSGGSSMPNATLITSYDKPGEDYGSSAYVPSSADKAALYGNEGYGEGMTGAQTSAYDTALNTTGSTSLANALSKLFGSGTARWYGITKRIVRCSWRSTRGRNDRIILFPIT